MTDNDLIARLRDEHVAASRTEAADRIEALIATVELVRGHRETLAMALDEAQAKLAENEVRLGKAVEALTNIDALDPENLVGGCSRDALSGLVNRMGDIARAALDRVKGVM